VWGLKGRRGTAKKIKRKKKRKKRSEMVEKKKNQKKNHKKKKKTKRNEKEVSFLFSDNPETRGYGGKAQCLLVGENFCKTGRKGGGKKDIGQRIPTRTGYN